MNDDALARFWSRVDRRSEHECWPWMGRSRCGGGYGVVMINGRNWRTHRLMYTLAVGPIPEGHDVCHTCDNPPCVNPNHLWVGTRSDNMKDMVRKRRGTSQFRSGTANPEAKLTPEIVAEIRASSLQRAQLARRYGVDAKVIREVLRGNTWKSVPVATPASEER